MAPLTMATVADLLKNLMDRWEASLAHTERTGYWPDTVACDRVIDAYAAEIGRASCRERVYGLV